MDWETIVFENWHVKFVAIVLVYAAYIDGKELRVPNWLTFPMVLSGLVYSTVVGALDGGGFYGAMEGLGAGLLGMTVGFLTLWPLWRINFMGAGDVKLMAGIGAWLGMSVTWNIFLWTAVIGAVMAVAMVLYSGQWNKHYGNFMLIMTEFSTVKDPDKIAEIAAERKPNMLLLPYGIPICVAALVYFVQEGMIY